MTLVNIKYGLKKWQLDYLDSGQISTKIYMWILQAPKSAWERKINPHQKRFIENAQERYDDNILVIYYVNYITYS